MKSLERPVRQLIVRKGRHLVEVVLLGRGSEDEDPGVPVPVHPRPRRGGNSARPPANASPLESWPWEREGRELVEA